MQFFSKKLNMKLIVPAFVICCLVIELATGQIHFPHPHNIVHGANLKKSVSIKQHRGIGIEACVQLCLQVCFQTVKFYSLSKNFKI